jgi:hypothetical protein
MAQPPSNITNKGKNVNKWTGRPGGRGDFNLISAGGVDVGAEEMEMPKIEGGEASIDKAIKIDCKLEELGVRKAQPALKRGQHGRCSFYALTIKGLCYPHRIQLLNFGLRNSANRTE